MVENFMSLKTPLKAANVTESSLQNLQWSLPIQARLLSSCVAQPIEKCLEVRAKAAHHRGHHQTPTLHGDCPLLTLLWALK